MGDLHDEYLKRGGAENAEELHLTFSATSAPLRFKKSDCDLISVD